MNSGDWTSAITRERLEAIREMPVRFFFYGTLMEGGGALRSAAPRRVGMELVEDQAKARGELYAVGASFPALVEGEGEVTGQLWETNDATVAMAALATFDGIEGYHADARPSSMYLREKVTLVEPAVEAFTYFWNAQRSYLSRIWSGDWRRWLQEPAESLTDRRGARAGRTIVPTTGHRPRS